MTNDELRNINKELDKYLPRKGKLARAMRYSVFAGGKRFRPLLCLATAKALGCQAAKVLPYACAIEMVHTFTLIHDDLPAMDDSLLRRGKPSCHIKYGEGVAILAGDALNTLAFRLIAGQPKAVAELAGALLTVVEGQVADLESPGKKMTVPALRRIHRWKTAALLKACVRGTALICGAPPAKTKSLTAYAGHLGLAFQIADDILDVTSSREALGKPVKADISKGFPHLIGLERSKVLALREKRLAVLALKNFDNRADQLQALADYVIKRGE
ncbi:MAG TPA: farnesyl diphosphate synthase [Candidatus Sulfotelmatobacter sp.]|nr:farnesyl diphosphate synthase [Candidatus Sulfotelmatobacter sp.]